MESTPHPMTKSWFWDGEAVSPLDSVSQDIARPDQYSESRALTSTPEFAFEEYSMRNLRLHDPRTEIQRAKPPHFVSNAAKVLPANAEPPLEGPPRYLQGWKLVLLLLAISLSVFLPNLEVTIVSTALVSISNDLHEFQQSGWVVVSYLITYTGFIIIWAKLSDIFKRKWSVIASLALFMAASGACGGATSMTMLIAVRAIQGIGAAGCYSVSMVIIFELIPPEKYAKYGSIISADVALASLLGPIFGGIITDSTTWRWVFLLNLPAGAVAIGLYAFLLPNHFPNHAKPAAERPKLTAQSLKRIDALGAFLLIGANLTLVTALLEASTSFTWSDPIIIALLTVSAALWIGFVFWEWVVTKDSWKTEPVFPFRFFKNRYWMGMLLQAILNGVPFTVLTINLPQRFQSVNGLSALEAGVRLLPYSLLSPIGSLVSNIIFSKKKIPLTLLLISACLQVLGLALMASTSVTLDIPPQQYVYEAITGFGLGFMFGTLVVITPASVEPRDLATATGAMIQMRQMGGAIGLTIGSSLLNSYLQSHLAPPMLSTDQLSELLSDISVLNAFPAALQAVVKGVFAAAYQLQLKVIVGFAAAQFLAIMLMMKLVGWRGLRIVGAR